MNVGLFVDTNSTYHDVKRQYESNLDYAKLLEFIDPTIGTISLQRAYVCQYKSTANRFLHCLGSAGYSLKTKEIRHTATSVCHWGVDISIDALELQDQYDLFCLVASHSDYATLLQKLALLGKTCVVLCAPPINNKLQSICRTITIPRSLCP